jgi:hypothetical protein
VGQEVKKPKTQPITVGFSEPPRTDESPQFVKIMDSNNVCLSPDGSEARNIDGSIVTNAYRVTTSPVGYKAIVRETNPPDVDQRMYMIINTAGGRNRVEQIEFGRNLGRDLQPVTAVISFDESTVTAPQFLDQTANVGMHRSGDLNTEVTVYVSTRNGTAIGGVDFTTMTNVPVVFSVGETNTEITISTSGDRTLPISKYYFMDISTDDITVELSPYSTISVSLKI